MCAANIACRVELEARLVVTQPAVLHTAPVVVIVPSAPGPPGAPGQVILILAIGISRLPVQAGVALGVVGGMGDDVLRHCRPCQRGGKNNGSAKKCELGHGIFLFAKRKVKYEPHAKLYAGPAQTQLKKYLFGKGFEHFATRAKLGADWMDRVGVVDAGCVNSRWRAGQSPQARPRPDRGDAYRLGPTPRRINSGRNAPWRRLPATKPRERSEADFPVPL